MSFHQLCYRQVARADRESGRDLLAEAKVTYPGENIYDVQLPNALAYSLDVLPERYEAIICDEGQDFREEFWVPLELLLADYDRSPLYVFYDDNQNIYARASTFPIPAEPFSLTKNCRNTTPIHAAAYTRYRGVPVSPPENEGEDVQFVQGDRPCKCQADAGKHPIAGGEVPGATTGTRSRRFSQRCRPRRRAIVHIPCRNPKPRESSVRAGFADGL